MRMIAGLDEVGMGSLAGPLVIVVTAFKSGTEMPEGVMDSKKLTKKKMRSLVEPITSIATFVGVGWASNELIDEIGIADSWQTASSIALENIPELDLLLIDGVREVKSYEGNQVTVKKGDDKHWQISAASIIAKVIRDQEMRYLHDFYPSYGWITNSGYGTKVHKEGLLERGPCPLHRRTFLKKILRGKNSFGGLLPEKSLSDGGNGGDPRLRGPWHWAHRTSECFRRRGSRSDSLT